MATKNHNAPCQNLAVSKAGASSCVSFSARETHGIGLWPQHRLMAHSDGLGWRHVYASFATEQPWSKFLPAIDHHCVAYCVSKANAIERRFDGDIGKQSAVLSPRQVGTIPAGVGAKWKVDGAADVLLIYLQREMVARAATEVLEISPSIEIRPVLGERDALLEQLALSVLSSLRSREPQNALYVEAIGQMISVHLLKYYARGATRQSATEPYITGPGLRRALELIETSLDRNLTLESLAATAGLTPFYFARSFKEKTGEAPHRYLIRRRIERSKEMLRSLDLSLVEVALATGFSSQSHFASTFRRFVGVTPSEYRSALVDIRCSRRTR